MKDTDELVERGLKHLRQLESSPPQFRLDIRNNRDSYNTKLDKMYRLGEHQ